MNTPAPDTETALAKEYLRRLHLLETGLMFIMERFSCDKNHPVNEPVFVESCPCCVAAKWLSEDYK